MMLGKSKGFTLIEVLIVAALLSLFAGIAVINIQQMYDSNKRKATFPETRALATAFSIARDNVGFFPNLFYLSQPKSLLTDASGVLLNRIDYMGFLQASSSGPPPQILEQWQDGPYYGMSQGRSGSAQGQGGIAKMRLPLPQAQANSWGDPVVWPADPYGNPYVLYLLKVEKGSDPPYRFVGSLEETADYLVAVVSYGPDGIPGSVLDNRGNPTASLANKALVKNPGVTYPALLNSRLYSEPDPRDGTYRLPFTAGYKFANNRNRILIIKNAEAYRNELIPGAPPNYELKGMLDPGSNDIVLKF